MKIRSGFISNSSSSSFVCDVCGANEAGYDITINDVEMCMCKNGHTICQEHLLNKEEFNIMVENDNIEYHEIPKKYCPICNMNIISHNDLVNYAFKKYNINDEELSKEIKDKFKNYEEFKKFLYH